MSTRPPPAATDGSDAARREQRVTINKEFESFDAFVHEYVTNISRTGAFVKSQSPLAIGTLVDLRFTVFMDDIEAIEGPARSSAPLMGSSSPRSPAIPRTSSTSSSRSGSARADPLRRAAGPRRPALQNVATHRPTVRVQGVVVPANFRKQPQLVLQVGLNMAVQTTRPAWASAIYALVSEDGPGMVWPEDVPPEVAAQMQAAVTRQKPTRPRPKLAAVGPVPADSAPEEGSSSEPDEIVDEESAAVAREPRQPAPRDIRSAPPREGGQPSARSGGSGAVADVVPIRPAPKKEPEAPVEAEAEAEDTPRPPAPRPGSGKKPRRELPPYLRLIK
jgi:hypothetical protein